jgi:hypothetical protein
MEALSREDLQGLRAKREEESRRRFISRAVAMIYNGVVDKAEKGETSYTLPLIKLGTDFFGESTGDILEQLRTLFPRCCITCKKVFPKERVPKMTTFANFMELNLRGDLYIIVDWS